MNELADDILVTILAATDAVFIPDRDPLHRNRRRVLYERTRDYPARGVPWESERALPELDEAGRKRAQRALEGLVARGLVVACRAGGKTAGVRLTDAGEALARARCGLPDFDAARVEAERLRRFTSHESACGFLRKVWTPETVPAGVEWGDNDRRNELVQLEERLLPALVRGFVVSNCSIQGHCWYSIHPNPAVAVLPPVPPGLPGRCEDARGIYYGRVAKERDDLGRAVAQNEREIGEIAMPVCPEPLVYKPAAARS